MQYFLSDYGAAFAESLLYSFPHISNSARCLAKHLCQARPSASAHFAPWTEASLFFCPCGACLKSTKSQPAVGAESAELPVNLVTVLTMLLDRPYHYQFTTSTSGIWDLLGTALPTPASILSVSLSLVASA